MLLLPVVVSAQDTVEIDGISFNLNADTKKATVKSFSNFYIDSVVIPPSITYEGVEYIVTGIGVGAFIFCSSLTSVTIPNSVTSIGNHAFEGCSSLMSITIPNSVTSIAGDAFYETGWYNNQSNGILYLDNWLIGYKGEKPTGNLVIVEGTRGIASNAFFNCSGLTSITIPNGVTSIGFRTFDGCNSLTSVTIPSSVTKISDWAFNNCSSLESIIVEKGNKVYDSRNDCNAIINTENNELLLGCKNTVVPNSVTSIGNNAFVGCSGLISISIPNSVTSIGNNAFSHCSGLISISIPNSVTSIGNNALLGCSSLISITIPNSVTSISSGTFLFCSSLTSVTIPNSVTSIGQEAFELCSSLNSVTIGAGVKTFYRMTFAYCEKLTDVYCLAEEVPAMKDSDGNDVTDAFLESPIENATLYVPAASIDAYKSKEPWKNFKFIKEITPYNELCDVNGDGTVDVADIASIIDVMAAGDKIVEQVIAADVNKDGIVDVADIAAIIDIMSGNYDGIEQTVKVYTSCPDDHHPHLIDLGLPSGTLWACCNLGASVPEDYGNYYAWGETNIKSVYNKSTYLYYSSYNFQDIGSDISGTEFDAATVNWGSPWRMPTEKQLLELVDKTTSKWVTQDYVAGQKLTGSNGGSIFLPAAGLRSENSLRYAKNMGFYWSSSLDQSWPSSAYYYYFIDSTPSAHVFDGRQDGLPIRPVQIR